ncbi:hypothetical protein FSP39_006465 [Pinctada imbricata]|uniref:PWWP domain-containing protein n=1 Tax=Pinctada imbricata TaxID=66713 RepID=A0AA89BN18_PINIB|nr:hypothetical protein FSP39_006465 [Pinctada imbricata]
MLLDQESNLRQTLLPTEPSGHDTQSCHTPLHLFFRFPCPGNLTLGDSKPPLSCKPGDVVWAKLEGYPWWPSLVCNHPTAHTHHKAGKNPQIHVQFFDEPPSRAWIKAKNVKEFKGSDHADCKKGGPFFSMNKDVQKGAKQADDAQKLAEEGRLKLVVDLQPSDDENEEDMEFDGDIFDDEMDDETDNSKENKDLEVSSTKKTPSKGTPSKSPAKARRSARKPQKKRRRIIDAHSGEDDSEDEFKPHSESDESDDASSGVNEEDVLDMESESELESPSPVKKANNNKRKRPPAKSKSNSTPWKPSKESNTTPWKPSKGSQDESDSESTTKKTPAPKTSFTPNVGEKTKSKLAMFSAPESEASGSKGPDQEANFPHIKLDFIQPEKIKDANGKRKNDPDYDPRTLYIPDGFKNSQTPAMRQWWELKSQLFDTVLFFKMGKFYELFHMDAVIAVNELGLIYMKGEHAHSGFPEIAYNRYADTLIQRGYKVARIEQTETPDMMQERVKNMSRSATKYDKVVKREVCRITTKGTTTLNFLDGDCSEAQSSYLLALTERVGQFMDDRHCSRLRTMLAHYTPVQVLLEKGKLSEKTQSVIDNNLRSVVKEYLRPGTEFWDGSKTLKVLTEEEYFKGVSEEIEWPGCLRKMISDSDSLGLTPSDNYTLAVKALGAVVWYLQYSLLDQEILSMKNFEEYLPPDSKDDVKVKKTSIFTSKQHMVLDGVTLANLDILVNSASGTQDGTLLQRLDHCVTPFGKRLFRQWLCAPLCNPSSISDRLDALDDLNHIPDVTSEVTELMRKLPDLERILGR